MSSSGPAQRRSIPRRLTIWPRGSPSSKARRPRRARRSTDPVVLGRMNASRERNEIARRQRRRAVAPRRSSRRGDARHQRRIEKLTAALADVQTHGAAAAAGSDRASRLAVAASALRDAVERGDPFTAELAIVKPLAPDANAIALLEPFAASGVPGNAALGQELADDRPAAAARHRTRRRPTRASSIACRPTPEARPRPPGRRGGARRRPLRDPVARRAARRRKAMSRGAMTELDKLPADARAPMQAWIAKAEARNKALDASRRLVRRCRRRAEGGALR